MRKPKFEIYAGSDGKFQFRLKAANGEPILTGRSFDSKPGAVRGIADVMELGIREDRFVRKTSANGKFYFQLRRIPDRWGNGQVMGWSELYESKQGRDKGILAVMKACQHGRIQEAWQHGQTRCIL